VRNFLLGVAATLAVLVACVIILVLTLGADPAPNAASSGATPPVSTGQPSSGQPSTGLPPTGGPSVGTPPADLTTDETWLGSVELRSQDVVAPEGDLVDVVAKGSGVRFGSAGLRAERLAIDATIPFDTVADQVGQDVTVYDAGSGRAGVQRTVVLLGRPVTVRATGTVTADGGELLIEPETVDLGGPSFLDSAASSLARALVTIRQPVAGVPAGMSLTSVAVTPQGFDATLVGSDVVIRR
jgi:hypothetical protein